MKKDELFRFSNGTKAIQVKIRHVINYIYINVINVSNFNG